MVAPKSRVTYLYSMIHKNLEEIQALCPLSGQSRLPCDRDFARIEKNRQRWSRGHKARGQGHKKNPGPRPKTAFPRTDPLEAKDRNARGQGQGPRTQPQAFSKKKRSSKFFFRRCPIHWRTQNFDWGRPKPQITWNDVIKIFPKTEFLWDKHIAKWKIWNCCLFARNQDFAKGEGLN